MVLEACRLSMHLLVALLPGMVGVWRLAVAPRGGRQTLHRFAGRPVDDLGEAELSAAILDGKLASLVLRKTLGVGTPRELRNRATELALRFFWLLTCLYRPHRAVEPRSAPVIATPSNDRDKRPRCRTVWNLRTCTTGC